MMKYPEQRDHCMLLTIKNLLTPDQLEIVRAPLAQGEYFDGAATAGAAAQRVKHNQELDRKHPARQKLVEAILSALTARPEFRFGAYPARIATPLFARYLPGMSYGDHIDDPLMGAPDNPYRSDLAMTLFLSDVESYDGGELVIETPFGTQQVKLPAGDAIIYPASSRHRVAEVTAGERLVMVTWIQSMVRDPAQREILHQLWKSREALLSRAPDDEATQLLDSGYTNLVRMWAEP